MFKKSAYLLISTILLFSCSKQTPLDIGINNRGIQGVRFDPSYYYNLKKPIKHFADSITTFWYNHGINTVFFKAYDPIYGAVYKTNYRFNKSTDYSKRDLLKIIIENCHRKNIQIIIWLPLLEHKGAWDANADWRIKQADGSDLIPEPGKVILCYNHPEVRKWCNGFLQDIISRYPQIDGIDIAEPASIWKGNSVCQCNNCKSTDDHLSSEFIDKRASDFTSFLEESFKIVKEAKLKSCLTLTITADRKNSLYPFNQQKRFSGIDLDHLLSSDYKPDWFSCEVLWQQWADLYDDPLNFSPEWTKKAIEQCLQMIGGRTHCISHVELTSLGPVEVTPQELASSIKASRSGGLESVEFYDTHLADSLNAWNEIADAFKFHPEQTVSIYYDNSGLGVARQIATLFGHFNFSCKVISVDSFSTKDISDCYVYIGTDEHTILPEAFKIFACTTKVNFFWTHLNLDKILTADTSKGFNFVKTIAGNIYNKINYKGKSLFKKDSVFTIIDIKDSAKVRVHAWAVSSDGDKRPYIVQSENFWYVADCPVDYMVEGGRHIAFSDLLHVFTNQDHPEQHTALVRIEDICVLTDPKQIDIISDYLYSERVPFSLAVVPFYVDPEENTVLSLSDRPQLVRALKRAVSKGGSIVMHGSTHQYRGLTTSDYEFWDELKNAPVFEDSKEYVKARIERGLAEFRKNNLFPVIWETPHYGASQLDYLAIREFFSSEYGRHQVIDKKGFDQLVPYYIYKNQDGISIIPENLGYIPSDQQNARPLLESSENNLAVRDGFASFFFHPWINLDVLKNLVNGIRKQGYTFADIKNTNLLVKNRDFTFATGTQSVNLNSDGKYIRTMYIDTKGNIRKTRCTSSPVKGNYNQNIICPSGWTFSVDKLEHPPKFWDNIPKKDFSIIRKAEAKFFETTPLKLKNSDPAKVIILCDKETQSTKSAWTTIFSFSGIDPDTVSVSRFIDIPPVYNLAVIPESAAKELSSQQTLTIAQWVSRGNKIILEKGSPLADQIGIHITDTTLKTTGIKDEYYSGIPVSLKDTMIFSQFKTDVENEIQYSTSENTPVVVSGEYGNGKFIFFSTEISRDSSCSDSRFPFFLDMIERQFSLFPLIRNPNLEVYYDPGTRENVSLEDLVKMWKKAGVSIVHIAGWEDYPNYTFEYQYFTNLLHQSGMLAYAWFDLPHISERFYLAHPEWREVTDKGLDATIGWRKLMNLTNDTCRAGAFTGIKRILISGAWDGINITGKMFEGNNLSDTGNITPFNPSFRAYYEKTYGYDPILITQSNSPYYGKAHPEYWNVFCSVRDSIEQAIILDFITFASKQLSSIQNGKEIIITRPFLTKSKKQIDFYDSLQTSCPFIRMQLSMDTLPVGLSSFTAAVDSVNTIFKNWKPIVEIDFDKSIPQSKTTEHLCGVELHGILSNAAKNSVRLVLKTESSIYDVDFKDLSFASAAICKEKFNDRTWTIVSPVKTEIDFDYKSVRKLAIDNLIWPAYSKGRAILPTGSHVLSNVPLYKSVLPTIQNTAILGFGGTIQNATFTLLGIELSYISAQNTPLVLSSKPKEIFIDGAPYINPSNSKGNVIVLPSGNHNLVVKINTLWDAIAESASIGLSNTIVIGSTAVIFTFLVLYTATIISRKRRALQQKK